MLRSFITRGFESTQKKSAVRQKCWQALMTSKTMLIMCFGPFPLLSLNLFRFNLNFVLRFSNFYCNNDRMWYCRCDFKGVALFQKARIPVDLKVALHRARDNVKRKFITPSIAALTVIEETLFQKNRESSFDPTIYCERIKKMEEKGNDLLVPDDKRKEL